MNNSKDLNEQTNTPKKMTLQEAIQKQLENKKNKNSANPTSHQSQGNKKMKSQQTKKVSNTRRKMGV